VILQNVTIFSVFDKRTQQLQQLKNSLMSLTFLQSLFSTSIFEVFALIFRRFVNAPTLLCVKFSCQNHFNFRHLKRIASIHSPLGLQYTINFGEISILLLFLFEAQIHVDKKNYRKCVF